MQLWPTLSAILICLIPAQRCAYHYDRPQTPFYLTNNVQQTYATPATPQQSVNYAASTAATRVQQTPTLTAVVRSIGNSNRRYEVHLSSSKQIYEGRQLSSAAGAIGGAQVNAINPTAGKYLPPSVSQQATVSHADYVNNNQVAAAGQYAAAYNAVSGSNQQLQYSAHVNPLLHTQYQQNNAQGQQTAYATAAAAQNAYAHTAASGQYAVGGNGQYNSAAAAGVNGIGSTNVNGQYIPPSSQYINGQNAVYNQGISGQYTLGANGQYASGVNGQYNGATNGQYGANGQFGAANAGISTAGAPLTGQIGDYISQSEAGQLDVYPHKQLNGDTRPYTRLVTTCYADGRCEQKTLAAGEVDVQNQQFIVAARARIQPVSDKCQRIAQAKNAAAAAAAAANPAGAQGFGNAGAAFNSPAAPSAGANTGPVRPKDRRLFPYSEVEQPRDAHN